MTKVKPISKQHISKCLMETIKCSAYAAHDLDSPQGIKCQQTRKQPISIAEMAGIDPQLICQAATWALSSTFTKYYRLNVDAKAQLDLVSRVLKLVGYSNRVVTTGCLAWYSISKEEGLTPALIYH